MKLENIKTMEALIARRNEALRILKEIGTTSVQDIGNEINIEYYNKGKGQTKRIRMVNNVDSIGVIKKLVQFYKEQLTYIEKEISKIN
jgi:hypothetical protein